MVLLAFSAISGPGELASTVVINSAHRVFPVPGCVLSLGIGVSKLYTASSKEVGEMGPLTKWT